MGRRSTVDLATLRPKPPTPDAPGTLSATEQALWRNVLAGLPPPLNTPSIFPLITSYVLAGSRLRQLSEAISAYEEIPEPGAELKRYTTLVTLENTTRASLATLSVKLRVSPSSRSQGYAARTAAANAPSGGASLLELLGRDHLDR
jgi:hypothetical protein